MDDIKKKTDNHLKPEILAPAGNMPSFLAGIEAGADAIYCGFKQYSARMAAYNFSMNELSSLSAIAKNNNVKLYIAFNSLIKPNEINHVTETLSLLFHHVHPDALIIQDLSLITITKALGYKGEIHLSTLTNMSLSTGLKRIQDALSVNRIVLPRELSLKEIKLIAMNCPQTIGLELFVHGALCYAVSGRCYWSSYLGGKSGLRGRCVQPCRRKYRYKKTSARFFSCQDLDLHKHINLIRNNRSICAWKIEGRKKGPHYVYHTVKAYRLLRDHGDDPSINKTVSELLNFSLGRKGTTYFFTPKPKNPIQINYQTGSGYYIGTIFFKNNKMGIKPTIDLLKGDIIRIGYEDEKGHLVYHIQSNIKKNELYYIKKKVKQIPEKHTPVLLIDRHQVLKKESVVIPETTTNLMLDNKQIKKIQAINFKSPKSIPRSKPVSMILHRLIEKNQSHDQIGAWLSLENLKKIPKQVIKECWWFFPPVIWPQDISNWNKLIKAAIHCGCKQFIINSIWQLFLFNDQQIAKSTIWAGPFCNISNPVAIQLLASIGIKGVIISPELSSEDILSLPKQSPLPLGIVIAGNWPLSISRIKHEQLSKASSIVSPKHEIAWIKYYDSLFWIFPNWIIDLRLEKKKLTQAGYTMFIRIKEPIPKDIKIKERPGMWNWDINLL